MRHLNYNHLLYFWTVAREGSIARASEVLFLTPQTISGQLKLLEESIGKPLFVRVGRRLVLSDTGQIVNQYADEIFSLGAELAQRMKGTAVSVNQPGAAPAARQATASQGEGAATPAEGRAGAIDPFKSMAKDLTS